MARAPEVQSISTNVEMYHNSISFEGSNFDLIKIKQLYQNYQPLTNIERDRVLPLLHMTEGETEEEFRERYINTQQRAFLLTVTIFGNDGQAVYGDSVDIFDSQNISFPIKKIFITNVTTFRTNFKGLEPDNRIQIWLNFEKPPIFDSVNPVSSRTPNGSKIEIIATNSTFYHSAINIAQTYKKNNKSNFSFIHIPFAYDISLLFIGAPYFLYFVTKYIKILIEKHPHLNDYLVVLYIYGIFSSLLLYRTLFSYLKWLLPIVSLKDNRDSSAGQRTVFWGIVVGLATNLIYSIFSA